ncbi:hypothetical protein MRBBS_2870 [Marinobacter sp. BSs20148]|nr:hypothetical protein MRBBS_2870 [Marinobacter sp. BSs20148]
MLLLARLCVFKIKQRPLSFLRGRCHFPVTFLSIPEHLLGIY